MAEIRRFLWVRQLRSEPTSLIQRRLLGFVLSRVLEAGARRLEP